jgi:hypothetical protein
MHPKLTLLEESFTGELRRCFTIRRAGVRSGQPHCDAGEKRADESFNRNHERAITL